MEFIEDEAHLLKRVLEGEVDLFIKEGAIIVLDLDNVLLDFTAPWPKWIKENYGKTVSVEDIKHWSPAQSFGNVNEDALIDWTYEQTLMPVHGAQEAVWMMKYLLGAKIYVLTARTNDIARASARRDIDAHFGALIEGTLFDKNKVPHLQALGADVFVDDKWLTIMESAEIPHLRRFLMDRPWNQCLDIQAPYTRVGDLVEVCHELTR